MRLLLEKKEKNLLEDSLVCEIHIEKSTLALELEKELGIDWSFEVYHHKEPYYHLRACIQEPIELESGEMFPFPTGIYPQILNPNFVIEVNSLSGLVYSHQVVMPEGVTYFPYTFRNEIWINLENKNLESVYIHPAQKIAQFTVKRVPRMVIKYVNKIEESPWKMNTGKKFIKHLKKQARRPGRFKTGLKPTEHFSREKIEQVYGKYYDS